MRKRIGVGTIAMLWLALGATGVQAAEATARACVTPDEAGGLILVLAPDAIKTAGKACAAVLPAGALLRRVDGPFFEKYQAEAARSEPLAEAAIAKIAGLRGDAEIKALGANGLHMMMSSILMPKLAATIKPKDCKMVDRIVASLEPLPPRNMADLFVTILQASNVDKAHKGGKVDIDICPDSGS